MLMEAEITKHKRRQVSRPGGSSFDSIAGKIVRSQATLMGYADAFGLFGVVLVCAVISVALLKRKGIEAGGGAH
jgi:hypothetical protein